MKKKNSIKSKSKGHTYEYGGIHKEFEKTLDYFISKSTRSSKVLQALKLKKGVVPEDFEEFFIQCTN